MTPAPSQKPLPTKAQIYRNLWMAHKGNAEQTAAAFRELGYKCSGQHVRNVNREYEVNRYIPTTSMVRLCREPAEPDIEPNYEPVSFDFEALLSASYDIMRRQNESTQVPVSRSPLPSQFASPAIVLHARSSSDQDARPTQEASFHRTTQQTIPVSDFFIDNFILMLFFCSVAALVALAHTGARPAAIAYVAVCMIGHVAAAEQRAKRSNEH